MGRESWYRNAVWNEIVEDEFRKRLRRTRDKAQYLRIQAGHLTNNYPDVALRLLDEYFDQGDHFDIAQAYVDRADAYQSLGDVEAALRSFEAALDREQARPTLLTSAYLDLPILVAMKQRTDFYLRSIQILNLHEQRPQFPVELYRWHGAYALLLKELGQFQDAKSAALRALAAAEIRKSDFRHHSRLGLVEDTSDEFGGRIRSISALPD